MLHVALAVCAHWDRSARLGLQLAGNYAANCDSTSISATDIPPASPEAILREILAAEDKYFETIQTILLVRAKRKRIRVRHVHKAIKWHNLHQLCCVRSVTGQGCK